MHRRLVATAGSLRITEAHTDLVLESTGVTGAAWRGETELVEIAVRHAVAADVPALLDFWARAGENASRPADGATQVSRLVAHDPEAVLLGEQEGRLVATVVAGWDGWRANLYRLAVEPDLRGRGLGRTMLRHAEERLRGLGAGRSCAMVLDDNAAGRGLWHSAGYAPQQDWRRWVRDLDRDLDADPAR